MKKSNSVEGIVPKRQDARTAPNGSRIAEQRSLVLRFEREKKCCKATAQAEQEM
jgi:hypothetical protein